MTKGEDGVSHANRMESSTAADLFGQTSCQYAAANFLAIFLLAPRLMTILSETMATCTKHAILRLTNQSSFYVPADVSHNKIYSLALKYLQT